MAKRLVVALAAGLSLGGCCHDGFGYPVWHSNGLAQLRPIPKPHHLKRSKPANANTVTMAPKDIPASEDAFSQSAEDELRKKLVICRGCETPAPNDQTGSIWPTRASGYLTVDQVSKLFPDQSSSGGGPR